MAVVRSARPCHGVLCWHDALGDFSPPHCHTSLADLSIPVCSALVQEGFEEARWLGVLGSICVGLLSRRPQELRSVWRSGQPWFLIPCKIHPGKPCLMQQESDGLPGIPGGQCGVEAWAGASSRLIIGLAAVGRSGGPQKAQRRNPRSYWQGRLATGWHGVRCQMAGPQWESRKQRSDQSSARSPG